MGSGREHRVVVVDDDHWTRSSMAEELRAHPAITVVDAVDQDAAVAWPLERWSEVDTALVDVFDVRAPGEVGTDVFSGIAVLEALADLPVRTVAVTPYCQHPLVQLRIHQAGADALYHRWEVNDLERLAAAILEPQEARRPAPPPELDLRELGAVHARPNETVRAYESSPLHGLLRMELGLKVLRLPRRTTDRFRRSIADTGFAGTSGPGGGRRMPGAPRWPQVRDYVLASLGRLDVPATEVDRQDLGPVHPEPSAAADGT